MHKAISKEWEAMVHTLFQADLSPNERILALHEMANAAEILAADIRRNARQQERGLA